MNIAVCSMVKNEEQNVVRMAESFKDVASHFFFLDTGSNDNTVEVAKRYGVVYEKEFENFVDSKNHLLMKVNELFFIDYIIWVDAKEFLDEQFISTLKDAIESNEHDSITTKVKWFNPEMDSDPLVMSRTRVWRNKFFNNDVKFHGPYVHEYIKVSIPEWKGSYLLLDVYISHNRKFVNADTERKKNDFYIKLLKDAIKDGIELNRALFYLGRTYMDEGTSESYAKAIEAYSDYIQYCFQNNIHFKHEETHALLETGIAYYKTNDFENALATFQNVSDFVDGLRIEPWFWLTKIAIDYKKDFNLANQFLNNAEHLIKNDIPQEGLFINGGYSKFVSGLRALINYNLSATQTKSPVKTTKNKSNINPLNEYFDRIYVLNLDRRKDRMERINKRMKHFGIEYKRFNAYDGTVFNGLTAKTKSKDPLLRSGNYTACTLSHLAILSEARNDKLNNILVIEDDALLNKNIIGLFNGIKPELEVKNEHDILYLGHCSHYSSYHGDNLKDVKINKKGLLSIHYLSERRIND